MDRAKKRVVMTNFLQNSKKRVVKSKMSTTLLRNSAANFSPPIDLRASLRASN